MADERVEIPYRTSYSILFEHPTNVSVSPNEPLDNTDDGATCSFSVYDEAKAGVLTSAEAAGQDVLSVSNPGSYVLGDVVEVDLDDGTIHDAGAIGAIDVSFGTIQVATALASAAAAGRRLRVRLGAAVPMAEYGTPALGETDWGFAGTLAANHAGLLPGLEVEIEVTFLGTGVLGGGLEATHRICATIVGECD